MNDPEKMLKGIRGGSADLFHIQQPMTKLQVHAQHLGRGARKWRQSPMPWVISCRT